MTGSKKGRFVEKKPKGPKYEPGFTRGQIFAIISNHPEGIEEGQIRDVLREKFGISERKGVKRHLDALERQGFVEKIPPPPKSGAPNIWMPARLTFENFGKLWSAFPSSVIEEVFSSTYVQECIQNRIVSFQVGCFYNFAPPEVLDAGVDFDLFIARSYELSPSSVINRFERSSNDVWLMYSVTSEILKHTLNQGSDLVTPFFESKGGQYIFLTLVELLVDLTKYPQKTWDIARFLVSKNTMKVLGLIFTDPTEMLTILSEASKKQQFDIWASCDSIGENCGINEQ